MKSAVYILLVFLFVACDDEEKLPVIPIDELSSIPDTIVIENQQLYLTTSMYRSFMPISPPSGSVLVAVAYITNASSEAISPKVSTDAIWVIYQGKEWKSFFTDDEIETQPYQLARLAKNGPRWGPDVYAVVVVRVIDGDGKKSLLRASNQYIGRVD